MLGGDLCKHLVNLLAAGVMTGAGPLRYGIWTVDVMVAGVSVTTDAECSPGLTSSSLPVPSHSHYVLFISYQPVNSPYLHFKIAEQKLNCITHLALMDLIFRLVEYVMDLIL